MFHDLLFAFLILLFIFLAGVANGIMDIIKDNWQVSIFSQIKSKKVQDWWRSKASHKHVGNNEANDYKRYLGFTIKPRRLVWTIGETTVFKFLFKGYTWKGMRGPSFIWDGWHCLKQVMVLNFFLAILTAILWHPDVYGVIFWSLWILGPQAWLMGFEPSHRYYWIQKKHREYTLLELMIPFV